VSRENIEIATRALAAVFQRPKPDFETVNALYHPEHVWVPVDATKLGGDERHGAGGYKAWLEERASEMPSNADLDGVVDIGRDTVIAAGTSHFRAASSGMEIEQRFWLVITVREGKIMRSESYLSPEEALAGTR
jgi:ketosteroid isomerase-like protein